MSEYEGLSPYIAESLRREKRARENVRKMRQALLEQGISEQRARDLTAVRKILGGPSAFEKAVLVKDEIQERERGKRKIEGPVGRALLLERDDYACYICGAELTVETMQLDHVLPLSRGGAHSAENLRSACGRCNSAKGRMTLAEYLATL